MSKILFADDEMKYRRLIELFLRNEGHQVITASNGEEMLSLFSDHPDAELIILDVMMPVMDGIQTCEIIREYSSIPILMLTALGDVHHEVKGLNQGADDYIAKPFSNDKLIARVTALLRRNKVNEMKKLNVCGLDFDEGGYVIEYKHQKYQLTQKEFLLMKILVINKNQVLERQSILDKVWGYGYDGDPRTLDTHIKSLRSKLGELSSQIVTVRGKGYYFRSLK